MTMPSMNDRDIKSQSMEDMVKTDAANFKNMTNNNTNAMNEMAPSYDGRMFPESISINSTPEKMNSRGMYDNVVPSQDQDQQQQNIAYHRKSARCYFFRGK